MPEHYREGYIYRASKIGADRDRPFVQEQINTYDSKEFIDVCLNCTAPSCNGNCEKTQESQRAKEYRTRKKREDELAKYELARELEKKERKLCASVAKMVLDGWRESAIARELGLTVQEVKDNVELAKKKRWLC